ncbi:putative oxidoreductase YjmC isoform X2 [Haematobia irritans]|uniref:putative oxidoreductase YjmC isoform X2 n=1 Tax=Haematobia irritans TaxID=7368 RepID=UPI003F50CB85
MASTKILYNLTCVTTAARNVLHSRLLGPQKGICTFIQYIQLERSNNIQGNKYRGFKLHKRRMSSPANKSPLVPVQESRRFMIDCFMAVNVPRDHAEQMADLLVAADYRGHFSHGMNRLEMYLNDLAINSTDGAAIPKILKETPSTAWVDGCNGLGAVVGNFCMDLAIRKAKQVGVGWVCAKGSNHYGIAGWYPMRAMKEGLVGMSMTNTSPLMAPTRSKEAALGTNPLSLGVPAKDDKFLLDMATTAVAVGKIEIQRRKGDPLPDGWAQDPEGGVTNDAELAFQTGCLMPLGGPEINSGYKGYGLGGLVDILSGVMSGANYSTKVRKWTHTGANTSADLGQVFIAVDPNCFAPDFEERMCDFNARLRGCAPTDPNMPVLVAGDKETMNMKAVDAAGGIQYLQNQLKTCETLSQRFNVHPMRFLKK